MKRYIFSILCGILILYLSVCSAPIVCNILSITDKLPHALAYGGWAFVIIVEHIWHFKIFFPSRMFLPAVVFTSLYGGAMELIQAYCFPNRYGDWWDFLADFIGALVVFLVCVWGKKRLIAFVLMLKMKVTK